MAPVIAASAGYVARQGSAAGLGTHVGAEVDAQPTKLVGSVVHDEAELVAWGFDAVELDPYLASSRLGEPTGNGSIQHRPGVGVDLLTQLTKLFGVAAPGAGLDHDKQARTVSVLSDDIEHVGVVDAGHPPHLALPALGDPQPPSGSMRMRARYMVGRTLRGSHPGRGEMELRVDPLSPVSDLRWEFFTRPLTGRGGPTGPLATKLREAGIPFVIPLQVGIDWMLSAATFGIARHTLGSFVQRLGGSQAGPVSIQAGSRLPAPRALDELRALARALDGGRRMCTCTSVRVTEKPVYTGITNSLARRQTQHGDRFALQQLTSDPLTRGQALRVGSSRR
jgi:hypothetical protein